MSEVLDLFYLKQPEPNRSCFLALRSVILNSHTEIMETLKYGMPCFLVGKKILFYLWKDKKTQEPYVLVADGHKLEHPKLEKGNRSRMKILKIDPNKDLPLRELNEVFALALQL